MKRFSVLIFTTVILSFTSILAQDSGTKDKVTIQAAQLTVGLSLPVPLAITNDQPIQVYNFGLVTESLSGFARFDSVRYVGRMSNLDVCNLKYGGLVDIDGTSPDTMVTSGFLAGPTKLPLSPGEGAVIELYFTGLTEGSMTINKAFLPPAGQFVMFPHRGDFTEVMFEPDFEGATIEIRPASAGVCGNIDSSVDGIVDISDLTVLIDYLFISLAEPPGMTVANVDASPNGGVDISDLTRLIDYLFLEGDPLSCL